MFFTIEILKHLLTFHGFIKQQNLGLDSKNGGHRIQLIKHG
jgi:hypothetical protein